MELVRSYVQGLEVGDVCSFGNISLAPLLSRDSSLEYLVLSDAIKAGFSLNEIKGGASVPHLYAENKSGKEVLGIVGEYVVGGMQNRILVRSIYLKKGFSGNIPVRCVEARRWRYESDWDWQSEEQKPREQPREPTKKREPVFNSGGVSPLYAYAASSQDEIWNEVGKSMHLLSVNSGTSSLGDIYKQKDDDFKKYQERFSSLEGQVGNVVMIALNGKKIFIADIFDKHATLLKYFYSLVRGYALQGGLKKDGEVNVNRTEMRGFLDSVDSCDFEQVNAVSLGNDFRIRGKPMEGSCLIYEDQPIYLNLFVKPREESHEKNEKSGSVSLRELLDEEVDLSCS